MAANSEPSIGRSQVTIRKLAISDVPAVAAILEESPEAASWSQESILQLATTERPAWVAERGMSDYHASSTFNSLESSLEINRIVAGFLVGRTAADEFEILNMAVSRTHRRIGIGSKLLESALEFSRNAGSARAYLEVRASNAPAIALYAHHGFTQCGRRPNYYRAPVEDALLLTFSLFS